MISVETQEILKQLPHLSINDRLAIVEAALDLIQKDQQELTQDERSRQLAAAALAAKLDYSTGSDLIAFSSLDGEDFYEYSNADFEQFDRHAEKGDLVSTFRSNYRGRN